jgi:HSP20 family protein
MAIIHREPIEDMLQWEPFKGIERLQQEMNHLFDRFLPSGNGEGRSLAFIPSAEMEETDDAIHLKLEVPGMDAKDLDVQVTEASVWIKGERKSESKQEKKGLFHSEFHYGQFERRLSLPAHVQVDQAKAEYKNGMLHLTLPKVVSEQRRAVKVNVT